jgi:hypothetical protein
LDQASSDDEIIIGVLRLIASSVLSLFLVATFLWGGCVSCEQYFMFPVKHTPCCNKSGQCERPGKNSPKPEKQDCNRLPFERTGSAHVLPMPAILPATVAPALLQSAPILTRLTAPEVLLDPSPPDVQALNVTFLI